MGVFKKLGRREIAFQRRCNMNRAGLIFIAAMLAIAPLSLSFAQAEQEETQATQTMEQMQVRMRAMQEQMARIQATEDQEERQRLMQEHMQSLQEAMGMMGNMMQGSVGQGRQARECPQNDTDCQLNQMQMQQRMMGQRMGMMQQMMQQMMEGMNQRHMMRGQGSDH
jgi:hypothetical protein